VRLAGLRRGGRGGPLRSDCAAYPVLCRRVSLRRQGDRLPRTRGRRRRADPRDRARGGRALPAKPAAAPGDSRRRAVGRVGRTGGRASGPAVRAAPVRPSGLHPLLVGHDGTPQVHGAWRRWNPAAAPEGARAARGPPPEDPALLRPPGWVVVVDLLGGGPAVR